jgi:hypothetical protein
VRSHPLVWRRILLDDEPPNEGEIVETLARAAAKADRAATVDKAFVASTRLSDRGRNRGLVILRYPTV